ncbi:ribonuclease III [Campylobacter hyointestinalis subsp. hyointestinalis]|uniref:Ribonuclease 3 n=1 Tax=Campylobacter hyointestinalis subsp. hyointestinalis TaxID=91352 RepID=A0A9W5ERJ3_CAMHY|nr:ribonuclease III [Campylobacter hyointestinalis]PPB52010.1 ribonuclease III [Campylobacter hyointestinalis subsp. hyointestinalis]PPB61471.1 ribonuclease III [Campylobacter hyointestinalis subsp. hyointestinalis]PPB65508.1 ribonuclease III [Campylobacter hyointestinalis subsp. hyointestinalis]PPB66355.1 ribonuclease III [Campylobacter hyointestinalis subsp. hyointestinalis]PPB68529.1 ribonuclease III [Campylobacter hyointestinalis subsp. hyointestinalis]
MDKLKRLENLVGYEFKNKELLKEALTHKSMKTGCNNERLEFLGDAVLDLIVGEYLFSKFEHTDEGNLSKLRAALVNEKSFAKLSNSINLGEFLYLSTAEENNNGRNKPSLLSDALEALMGAIYLESGLEKVKDIFTKLLEKEYQNIDLKSLGKDYKTTLQEITQARFGVTPKYELVSSSGPDHKKVFEMAVYLEGKELARSFGPSKKEAEQSAALKVLQGMEQ